MIKDEQRVKSGINRIIDHKKNKKAWFDICDLLFHDYLSHEAQWKEEDPKLIKMLNEQYYWTDSEKVTFASLREMTLQELIKECVKNLKVPL